MEGGDEDGGRDESEARNAAAAAMLRHAVRAPRWADTLGDRPGFPRAAPPLASRAYNV